MFKELALLVLFVGLIMPLLHVAISPRSGSWLPPAGGKCPFGPRVGWLMIVLVGGLIGWAMYMKGRNSKAKKAS